MLRWLKNHGFALLVLLSLAGASFFAGSAAVPQPVPDYALRAEEIYRLKIGAAFFVAFYLVTMAIALALGGRGFAEFGTRGLKAATIVGEAGRKQQAAIARQEQIDRETHLKLDHLQSGLDESQRFLKRHQKRLDELEAER